MNTEECCNHNCNQGRDCPLRKKELTDEEIHDLIINKTTDADMIKQALRKAQEK
jgi:hypothetical protein